MKINFSRSGVLTVALLATLGLALFCASCSGGDNPAALPSSSSKTLYKASSNLSDYASKTVGALGYSAYSASNADGAAPDVFVVKGSDLASLSDDNVILALKTCLEGKALVIDCPSEQNVRDFGAKLDSALDLEKNAFLKARAKLDDDSPNQTVYQLVSALSDADGADSNTLTHAAIGICGDHIYYVHEFPNEAQSLKDESAKRFSEWIRSSDEFSASAQIDATARSLVAKSSAVPEGESALDDLIKAQIFTHNVTDHGQDSNADSWLDATVTNYVWTICDLERKKDYYLVKTSVTCHNEKNTTGYKNYFANCKISSSLGEATLIIDKCDPQTSQGSENFTTGSSITDGMNQSVTYGVSPSFSPANGFSIGGNVGGSTTWTHSKTTSHSSTISIPDVSVAFTTEDYNGKKIPNWVFTAPVAQRGQLKAIQKNSVTFVTYALYELASDVGNDDGTVEYKPTVSVDFYDQNKNANYVLFQRFDDHIKKPCNSKGEYMMSFDRPEGMTDEKVTANNSILKEYMSDWNNSVFLYAVGENHLDCVAESCLDAVCGKIETNKNIFQGRGFKGKFTFYIQNVKQGKKVKSREIEF